MFFQLEQGATKGVMYDFVAKGSSKQTKGTYRV